MRSKQWQWTSGIVTVTLAGTLLSGCILNKPEALSGEADGQSIQADYPVYNREQLFERSQLVVEATVKEMRSDVLHPESGGDDPMSNPQLGVTETSDISLPPAIAVTMKANTVFRGELTSGSEFEVFLTGTYENGTAYPASNEADLELDGTYLLFLGEGPSGSYFVLGGAPGAFVKDNDGTFVAMSPDLAAAPQFTSDELAAEFRR